MSDKQKTSKMVGAVMVVGGGLAGIKSSLDLVEAGFKVYLVDKKPYLGGVMAYLDKQFPTNNCQICSLSPKSTPICRINLSMWLDNTSKHKDIDVIAGAEVIGIDGAPGDFKVKLNKKASYIDLTNCTGCGECEKVCPVELSNPLNCQSGIRKAIYKPNESTPKCYVIDTDNCTKCGACEKTCPSKAIDFKQVDENVEIEVGAIILSTGYELFDATQLDYYGYGEFPNVLTSIDFEKWVAPANACSGLIRPSDHKTPKKIAWIQCVGSRNKKINKNYCSSVCCMHSIKEAIIAKEQSNKNAETTIFYMDMRTCGKDYERYYNKARDVYGVKFERSRIFAVEEVQDGSNDLMIRYSKEDGTIIEENFDMVVLAVGFSPNKDAIQMAKTVGISLNEHGFCSTPEFEPGYTTREGIFASGTFCEPKDIPETVVDASSAAAYASRMLNSARGSMMKVKEYPAERDVSKESPRIGVFVCAFNEHEENVINSSAVVENTQNLKDVVFAVQYPSMCSTEKLAQIKEDIIKHQINRVVVASCSPRTHAELFKGSLRQAGLNPYLYEHVNLREQVSWVHRNNPNQATNKAKDLVKMAVAKVKMLKQLKTTTFDIEKSALVLGGGISGLVNAISLAEQGIKVTLVEKSSELGGNAKHIQYTLNGNKPIELINKLINDIKSKDNIEVLLNAEVTKVLEAVGKYVTKVKLSDGTVREIKHGALVIASGGEPVVPEEYLYGQHPAVVTHKELEEKLTKSEMKEIETAVFIQCVGSREENRPYCSRICCAQSIKNALKIKEKYPKANVFVLYRDIRTYGFKEQYYDEARQKGIIFIRYDQANKPEVTTAGDKLAVQVMDHILRQPIKIEADILVLASGVKPNNDNAVISNLLATPLDQDGFFAEAHQKTRPVDMVKSGLFLCGLAHSPKTISESITQANAAAMRVATYLCGEKAESLGFVATVDEDLCRACGLCVSACPYGARVINSFKKVAKVNELLCQGCGSCVAVCPSGASQQNNFEKGQILSMLDAVL